MYDGAGEKLYQNCGMANVMGRLWASGLELRLWGALIFHPVRSHSCLSISVPVPKLAGPLEAGGG
jgi:hypothetical protein